MNTLPALAAAVSLAAIPFGALAAAPFKPPMNDFNQAFYTCDGGAFTVSYDSDAPEKATLITSSNNKHYELTRAPTAQGAAFAAGPAKFWTDGKTATFAGTDLPLRNCATKAR